MPSKNQLEPRSGGTGSCVAPAGLALFFSLVENRGLTPNGTYFAKQPRRHVLYLVQAFMHLPNIQPSGSALFDKISAIGRQPPDDVAVTRGLALARFDVL